MQTLIFRRHSTGVSKTKGEPYDMVEVSNGLDSFTLSPKDEQVSREIDDLRLEEGQEFQAEIHVTKQMNTLRGIIVAVQA